MESKDNRHADVPLSPGSGEQAGQDLRRQAKERLSRKKGALSQENPEAMTPDETRRMINELRVYQIELEMQNEELQKSHAEIDAIRARYFDLYDLAPVGYCTISEKELILEANLTAATLLDVSRSTLIQRPMSRFILMQDQDICYMLLKHLFETDEPQACELRMMRRNGTSFWARMEATSARDADGAPVGRIILSDITERQTGEALRQSEEKYRNIYYHSVLGIFRSTFEGRFIDMNPALARLLGYDSPQEAIDLITSIAEQIYARPPERDAAAEAVLEAGGHISKITHYRRRDGAMWYGKLHLRIASDQQGMPSHYEGFVEDITLHKQTEDALRESEARLREVLENSLDASYKRNLKNNSYDYLSPVFARISGYSQDEMKAMPIENVMNLIHPDDLAEIEHVIAEAMTGATGATYQVEYRFKHKDGQYRWFHDRFTALQDDFGQPLARIGSVSDISDRKLTDIALQEAGKSLQTLLSEKDILLKEVHHRVKNNLAVVMGLLDLQGQVLKNDPARIALSELSTRIKSMAMIHEQLYLSEAFSRIDFQFYLEELCAYLRSSYYLSGDISVSVSAVGVEIGLDIAVPCGLLITELVTNAFKYAFPAGWQPEAGCKIDISAQWDGSAYTLAVADNGVGLPAGLDWSNTKTMGLVLVKLLGQHQLQGRIEVDCTAGTTFRLRFADRNKLIGR